MKILLINTNTIKPAIAPVGLEYVAEYLKSHHVNIITIDLSFQPESEIEKAVKNTFPDFIGINIRNLDDCRFQSKTFFLPEIKKIVTRLKKITDAPIIAGGGGFSVSPESALEYLGLDYGICRDGEEAMLSFIESFKNPETIPNLIYKKDGIYIRNKQQFFDLRKLNPERTVFDNKRYFNEGGMGSVETKRGCIKDCIYCVDYLTKGKCLRLREPKSVVKEMEKLYEMGITHFHLCDSEFNIPHYHAVLICQALIKSDLSNNIKWYCYCSPKEFDYELAKMMVNAGCAGINFGVDSASEDILTLLKRDFTSLDLVNTAETCHRYEIPFMYDLLFGVPGENERTINETIELMKKIKPTIVGTAIGVRLYNKTPMTELVKDLLAKGAVKKDCLYGDVANNDDFLKPVFYISPVLGEDIFETVEKFIDGDKRFIFSYGKKNYNYNSNKVLINAIKEGSRGAYWDILRKIK